MFADRDSLLLSNQPNHEVFNKAIGNVASVPVELENMAGQFAIKYATKF